MSIQQKGYILIKNFLNEEEIGFFKTLWSDWSKKNFSFDDDTIVRRSPNIDHPDEHIYVKKVENWLEKNDVAFEFYNKKVLPRLIEETGENHLQLLKERFINQSHKVKGYLPHQDCGTDVMPKLTQQMYTAYISLTNTDEESGCMWFEDREQKRTGPVVECPCSIGNPCACTSTTISPMDIKFYKGFTFSPLKMEIGDMLIFDGWCLHGTATNLSSNDRTTITFAVCPAREGEDKRAEWQALKLEKEKLYAVQ